MAKKKRHEEEEHENHERWLVTYADMVTLLMVLFIVMFAMSSVDQAKFSALKSSLSVGFGQSNTVLTGSTSLLDQPGVAPISPVSPQAAPEGPRIEEMKEAAATEALAARQQRAYAEAAGEADRLLGIRRNIMAALRQHGLARDVVTTIDGRGLTVSLVSRHIVFEANLATLTPRGHQIVDTLAPILAEIDDKLQIEGHTNQAPGRPKYYASNWDLASARAITVLRHLNERRGIPQGRLAAVGHGDVKPLVDPSVPGSQRVNKRVDIVVLSRLAQESSQLLDRVMYDRKHGAGGADKQHPGTAQSAAAATVQQSTSEKEH